MTAGPEDLAHRKGITFEQAEGHDPLPTQLSVGEISREMRARLWSSIYVRLTADDWTHELEDPWKAILRANWVLRLHRPIDEFDPDFAKQVRLLKAVIFEGDYLRVFGLLQYIVRNQFCPEDFREAVALTLEISRSAYRLIEKTIIPIGSEYDAKTVHKAFEDLKESGFSGGRSHLIAAAEMLSAGDYSGSVRESIHAVESTARKISPEKTLGKALDQLEKTKAIHPSLKRGFSQIYGYTSDEKGIRHPLVDDAVADVDETDALFMLGACSAFISYLVAKQPRTS